jgi:CDP-paratose 2-epimerase
MSCIYGPRQIGTEDQGWVVHFFRQALEGSPITIYGDGRQVRDLLFVQDLVEVLILARERSHLIAWEAFNIGGGPANAASIREVLRMIAEFVERDLTLDFGDWRPGDQKYYVSDYSKFETATGWSPVTSVEEGMRALHTWVRNHEPSKQALVA